ncbi:MAG TPA: hypothetical protein VF533_03060 [Solirubrobacteraceae bacterium]|jgi:hypothetical protein
MSQGPGQPPEYTEEELRALEAEMERITIDDVLLQTIVSLINLTARKAGLAHDPDDPNAPQPDWAQVRQGIDAARALLAIVEPRHGAQLGPIRDGLSRLQMHYVQNSGAAGAPADDAPAPAGQPAPAAPPQGGGQPQPGDAQRTGRLWIPGQ